MIDFEPILIACITGALYSIVWWSTKRIDPTKPDFSFDPIPLVATMVIGAGVGIFSVTWVAKKGFSLVKSMMNKG